MRWFFAPEYDYARNLPQHGHVHGFLVDKPSRIRRALLDAGVVQPGDLLPPHAVTEDEVASVHTREVLIDLHDAYAVSRALEFDAISLLPAKAVWEAVVSSQLHAAGGTCEALAAAAAGEWCFNLSGGFHHARPALAHGFCLLNDVALAVARLRREGARPRIAIVDLDVHQGDGNAVFFAEDGDVFTLSVHERDLFPVPKAASDLDVALASGIGEDEYLSRVDDALAELRQRFAPEIVIYVAGTDVYEGDPLGSLRVSREGVVERDRRVARMARELGVPLVTLPAGGYSEESAGLAAAGFAAIVEVARDAPPSDVGGGGLGSGRRGA